MNEKKQKVTVQISPEWIRIIKMANQISYGELKIKTHQGKVELIEYTIKKKPSDDSVILPQIVEL